jgi:hypothetical protein
MADILRRSGAACLEWCNGLVCEPPFPATPLSTTLYQGSQIVQHINPIVLLPHQTSGTEATAKLVYCVTTHAGKSRALLYIIPSIVLAYVVTVDTIIHLSTQPPSQSIVDDFKAQLAEILVLVEAAKSLGPLVWDQWNQWHMAQRSIETARDRTMTQRVCGKLSASAVQGDGFVARPAAKFRGQLALEPAAAIKEPETLLDTCCVM